MNIFQQENVISEFVIAIMGLSDASFSLLSGQTGRLVTIHCILIFDDNASPLL